MPEPGTLSGIPYASRLSRLVAFGIDLLLFILPAMPTVIFYVRSEMLTLNPDINTLSTIDYTQSSKYILVGGIVLLVIFVIQLFMLSALGQTIGKRALHIRIVKKDTLQNGGFVPNVLLRTMLNGLLGYVPFYPLIDFLFIFREDRRCIHDLMAGTIVIRA